MKDRRWSRYQGELKTLEPSPRQVEVFLTTLRVPPKQAAVELGLSYQTVKNHIANLTFRMGARSRTELARIFWIKYPEMRDKMVLPIDILKAEPEDTPRERPSGNGRYIERRLAQRRK